MTKREKELCDALVALDGLHSMFTIWGTRTAKSSIERFIAARMYQAQEECRQFVEAELARVRGEAEQK
jgi:hypothetical protein